MKKSLLGFLFLSLAVTAAPRAARARDRDRDRHGGDYSRIEERMGDLDSRLDRLAALRDTAGSDRYLRTEINRAATMLEHIRRELRHRDVSPRDLWEETEGASWRLSRLEQDYRELLSSQPRRRVIVRHYF